MTSLFVCTHQHRGDEHEFFWLLALYCVPYRGAPSAFSVVALEKPCSVVLRVHIYIYTYIHIYIYMYVYVYMYIH